MTSITRPTMVSHPSSQSSPPPSPVYADTPSLLAVQQHPVQATSSRLLGIDTTASSLSKAPYRPRLPGRQETPPSPPNSVVLGDRSPVSPAIPSTSSSAAAPTNQKVEPQEHNHHNQTPPPSLKQRITRVFKAGHKRGESDLSRCTMSTNDDATVHQDVGGHIHSPLKENEPDYPRVPTSNMNRPRATSIRPINNYLNNNAGATKKTIMNGGEVRVEIRPPPSLARMDSNQQSDTRGTQKEEEEEEDSSSSYYRYYTRSSRGPGEQSKEGYKQEKPHHGEEHEEDEDRSLPPLNHHASTLKRSQTLNSNDSSGSQERRYVEESISFGFEGFHIGNGSIHSEGTHGGLSNPVSPVGMYSNSGKASSSVLNYMNSELNILSRNPSSGKSSGALGRPGISRNASSTSYFSPGMRRVSPGPGTSPGSLQLDEAVSRELRRLSKISAGSGTSGFAIVITADGAASTRLEEEEFSDQELDRVPFTKEEKGKGRAASSVASERVAERKGGDSRNGNQGKGHQYTTSDASKLVTGNGNSQNSSENGDSDGTRELLKGMEGGAPRRKLKAQEVQKGVLVHQADSRYEFVYRLRQTSDETPILVPQYFYPGDGAFPNRNALTSPIRAKFSPVSPINTSSMSFGGQYNSSPITKPRDAYQRSPSSSHSYFMNHGGDQTFDSPAGSPHYYPTADGYDSLGGSVTHSLSETKMESLVHPALRNGGDESSVKRQRSRTARSLGSIEGLTEFGGGRLVTGTPNGTGRRLAGSSLADSSDLNMREDSPERRVRMSEVTFIPPLVQPKEPRRVHHKSRDPSPRFGTRLPRRPKDLRRSMTPRLYAPRHPGDSWEDLDNHDPEASQEDDYSREYRAKEKRAGITILVLCMLFPPLLLLVAMGAFDTTVDGWTDGEVKGVGQVEKRVAAVVGGIFAIAAVVGGVVAAALLG